jgi:hypothetical protein
VVVVDNRRDGFNSGFSAAQQMQILKVGLAVGEAQGDSSSLGLRVKYG